MAFCSFGDFYNVRINLVKLDQSFLCFPFARSDLYAFDNNCVQLDTCNFGPILLYMRCTIFYMKRTICSPKYTICLQNVQYTCDGRCPQRLQQISAVFVFDSLFSVAPNVDIADNAPNAPYAPNVDIVDNALSNVAH